MRDIAKQHHGLDQRGRRRSAPSEARGVLLRAPRRPTRLPAEDVAQHLRALRVAREHELRGWAGGGVGGDLRGAVGDA